MTYDLHAADYSRLRPGRSRGPNILEIFSPIAAREADVADPTVHEAGSATKRKNRGPLLFHITAQIGAERGETATAKMPIGVIFGRSR